MKEGVSSDREHFDKLTELVDQLLAISRGGDWERVVEMEADFLASLQAVADSREIIGTLVTAHEISSLQKKMGLAIQECVERKAQIAPLVQALSDNTQHITNTP